MKAVAVFPRRRQVRLIDHPEPRLRGPRDVKVRVLEAGVCATDRHIAERFWGGTPKGCDYLILGHEALAEVVESGRGVRTLRKGDLVTPVVRRPCGVRSCRPCRAGRQDYCVTHEYLERGIMGLHGYMTEVVVEEERFLVKVPRALKNCGVLIEPLTIGEKGFLEAEQVQKRLVFDPGRERAAVVGAGSLGILGAMALLARGYRVTVYSRSPKPNLKASIVESIGADYVSSERETPEALARRAGPFGLIYEAAGAWDLSFELMKMLGPNGVFIFGAGQGRAPAKDAPDFVMRHMVGGNKAYFGTVNAGPDAFVRALRDLAVFRKRWPKALARVITGRHPIEDYRELLLGKQEGIKNIIEFK